MAQSKKFLLIPEDKHVITKSHLTELDKELLRILNSHLPDSEKLHKYYELLQKRLNLQQFNHPFKRSSESIMSDVLQPSEGVPFQESSEEKHKKVKREPTEKMDTDYESIIISSIPEKVKKKAQVVLNILKRQPDLINWTDHGEMIYHREKLPHTNIADLIGMILTDRKVNHIRGKEEFLKVLQEMNVPTHFVKNKHLNLEIKESPAVEKIKPFPINRKLTSRKRKSVTNVWLTK